jgi:hypothetical protein
MFPVEAVESSVFRRFPYIKKGTATTYPQCSNPVLIDVPYTVVAKTGRIARNIFKMGKLSGLFIKPVKTTISTYPKSTQVIPEDNEYRIISKT